ncbi:MAG: putative molybdenum carrier protein [Verrucomicrobiota bacterium]
MDACYQLKETPSADYVQRTEWNVRDSDGSVVFSIAPVLTGGSKRKVELAHKARTPVIHFSDDGSPITETAACSPEKQGATMMDMNWRAIERPGIMPAFFAPAGAAP